MNTDQLLFIEHKNSTLVRRPLWFIVVLDLAVSLALFSCSTTTTIPTEYLADLGIISKQIENKVRDLDSTGIREDILYRTIGETGYYSVVTADGLIVAHPRIDMIGENPNVADPERLAIVRDLNGKEHSYIKKGLGGQEAIVFLHPIAQSALIISIVVPFERQLGGLVLQKLRK